MDVVSEILRAVKLKGALFFHGEFSAPWCFRTSPPALAPYLTPDPGHLILFHLVTEGQALIGLPDSEPERLNAGDIVVVPHGHTHLLSYGSPSKPVDSAAAFADGLTRDLTLVRYGGGGEATRFVCGFLTCDPRLSEVLLAGLPPLLRIPIIQSPADQWLEHAIRYSVGGTPNESAGNEVVISKLAEVLFVETLRRYVNSLPPEQTGWLSGTRDISVGKALALMHRDPAHPWTMSELARETGLSRSRLTERFGHFLGESPMEYLTRWRLKIGAELLESTKNTVAEIAAAVGYGSEATFNRAFKRQFGCPPAQFRRGQTVRTATIA